MRFVIDEEGKMHTTPNLGLTRAIHVAGDYEVWHSREYPSHLHLVHVLWRKDDIGEVEILETAGTMDFYRIVELRLFTKAAILSGVVGPALLADAIVLMIEREGTGSCAGVIDLRIITGARKIARKIPGISFRAALELMMVMGLEANK